MWRLTFKGQGLIARPKVEEFRVDPLVAAAVKLNKLICTGMAMRYPEARQEALNLCGSVENGLRVLPEAVDVICTQSEKNERTQ